MPTRAVLYREHASNDLCPCIGTSGLSQSLLTTCETAGQRYKRVATGHGEKGPVFRGKSHPDVRAEPAFEDGDLVAQGENFDVLVSIPQGSSRSAAKVFVTVR
ncbi:hypothetical protein [Nonomuraea polychroma]|uniref:hypothetical protein n=1 Tax=Nonomuraea polychroma TaxID=46176 RepID=UPI0013E3C690|nr:hypothetical protein [Nonomuraea polychroma]